MSYDVSSTTWADGPEGFGPGTVIGGFRIDRLIGRGSDGAVYEATQLSLDRTVALRLLEPAYFGDPGALTRFEAQQLLSASLHHPSIVPTYEAGEWEGGRFVATRFIRGRSLENLLGNEALPAGRSGDPLAPIADALETALDVGLVHGRINARNVLMDAAGNLHLADLGLSRPGSAAGDREALANLESGVVRGRDGRRRRSIAVASIGVAAIAVIAVALLVAGGSGDNDDPNGDPPPPVAAATVPLGSALAPGPVQSTGCAGEPGPNTPACTLGQSTISGKQVEVRRAGVIRRWAVRGASGDLTLQVIGQRHGKVFLRGFSQVERVSDLGPHAFETDVSVRAGDRIAVLLAPGAAVGVRLGAARTLALRRDGSVPFEPQQRESSGLEGELMLRADIEPGARPALQQITGMQAVNAPSGSTLGSLVMSPASGGAVRVEVVRTGDAIVVDGFRGRQRLARAEVAAAESDGKLLALENGCGFRQGFCLRWLNQGDSLPVLHAYRLARDGIGFQQIG
jgi:hypothetical protein